MGDDSPVLCWTREEEFLVKIAGYVEDTRTLSLISRCTRYCYEMLLPRRCRRIDVFIVDMPSLLLFVKRHIDATYRCRTLEVRHLYVPHATHLALMLHAMKVIGKADINNDPRSRISHEALIEVLLHIGTSTSGLQNFSYTTPWNESFCVPNRIWTTLRLSRHLEELDSTILLDRDPVCFPEATYSMIVDAKFIFLALLPGSS